MPNIQVYVSDDTYRKLLRAADEAEAGMSVPALCGRLIDWFQRSPDTPLRRSAVSHRSTVAGGP
jgi:hypothetical protein